MDIIRKEKLLVESRPRTPSTGLLTALGKAIGVGSQATKAPEEMSALRDAAGRGDEDATTKAIGDVYKRLGWKSPEAEAMAKLRQASVAAVAGKVPAPASFERKATDYTVTVVNDRAQAAAEINVVMNAGPDGKPARLVLDGKLETKPNLDGSDLETHAQPDSVKTYDAADLAKVRTSLNGRWIDQDGDAWEISGNGSTIVLLHKRTAGERKYQGTVEFRDVQAAFSITSAEHLSESLPASVRQQLAGMGLDFRLRLKFDDTANRLRGVWISRNVTYTRGTQKVERVHDPYDAALTLKRAKRRQDVAGRYPDEGP